MHLRQFHRQTVPAFGPGHPTRLPRFFKPRDPSLGALPLGLGSHRLSNLPSVRKGSALNPPLYPVDRPCQSSSCGPSISSSVRSGLSSFI